VVKDEKVIFVRVIVLTAFQGEILDAEFAPLSQKARFLGMKTIT
jgi:hypothetical protein